MVFLEALAGIADLSENTAMTCRGVDLATTAIETQ